MNGCELAYFLHIPKTAGTSVHSFLVSLVAPGEATPQLLWDDLVARPDVISDVTRVVTGHFGGLLPLWLGVWPTLLTVVRDPVARALSHINHVRREPTHPLHDRAVGLSVAEYCADPVLNMTIDNFQARYLASLSFARVLFRPSPVEVPPNGVSVGFERALFSLDPQVGLESAALEALDVIDGVGIAEQLDATLALFGKVLGRDVRASAHPHLNTAGAEQQTLHDLHELERAALERHTVIDQAVYDRARLLFARSCEAHGIGTAEDRS